ncbi:MAG: hypothetical protein R3C20_11760 [Planctomycetaceae bacterium]
MNHSRNRWRVWLVMPFLVMAVAAADRHAKLTSAWPTFARDNLQPGPDHAATNTRPGSLDDRVDAGAMTEGIVTEVDDHALTIAIDGNERTFRIPNSCPVLKDGVSTTLEAVFEGDVARVTDRDGNRTPEKIEAFGLQSRF